MSDIRINRNGVWWDASPSEALRALLTDECPISECDAGQVWPYGEDSRPGDSYDCSACGGRGWLPKDGVLFGRSFNAQGDVTMMLEFPLDWLKAEDES